MTKTIAKTDVFTVDSMLAEMTSIKNTAVAIVGKKFDLFIDTAWLVYNILQSPELLRGVIAEANNRDIKIPLAVREKADEKLDAEQKAKLATQVAAGKVENLHLFVYRVIFNDSTGTLRSFENQAYPAREASEQAYAKKLNTKSDFASMVKNFSFLEPKEGGTTHYKIEGLRIADRYRYDNGSRGPKPVIPAEALTAQPLGVIARAIMPKVKKTDGWGIVIVHDDGKSARVMFDAGIEGDELKTFVAKAFAKAPKPSDVDLRAFDLPENQIPSQKSKSNRKATA